MASTNQTALAINQDFTALMPIITLSSDDDFEAIRASLRAILSEGIEQFDSSNVALNLGSRTISQLEIRRICTFLLDEFGLEVGEIQTCVAASKEFVSTQLKLEVMFSDEPERDKTTGTRQLELLEHEEPSPTLVDADDVDVSDGEGELPCAEETPLLEKDAEAAQALTEPPASSATTQQSCPGDQHVLSVHRTIRSGNSLQFDGDVIIYGDVNPGAEVIISGNLTVLGSFKGMAHVGSNGDTSATMFALSLSPTQLRIADLVAKIEVPAENTTKPPMDRALDKLGESLLERLGGAKQQTSNINPSLAKVIDGVICIDRYTGII